MGMLSIELLIGVVLIFLCIRYYLTKNYDYWKKLKIPGPEPILFFGTFKDVGLNKIHAADYLKHVYDLYPDAPVVGLFIIVQPVLLVKDLDMIRDVLVRSFTDFPNRGIKIHEDIEPLTQHLAFLEYETWKPLRKRLTPTFTSGKLREMFYLVNECADHFVVYLNNLVSKTETIDCCEVNAKFTTDVIGVCVFGLNMNGLADEDSEFRKVGRKLVEDSFLNTLRFVMRCFPHWFAVLFKPLTRDEPAINFFVNTVKSAMASRKKNNIRKHDFIDLLMDVRDNPEEVGEEAMSDIMLAAQAFVFFFAGFETTSNTLSNAMYELALNPGIQEKLRNEVKVAADKNKGKLNYDALKNMPYLDKIFKETLRKYAPLGFTTREARNDYTFAEKNITVPKGTLLVIPSHGIHHDPSIYPDPEKFDPERFEEEAMKLRSPMAFLPFGSGPRICIGERFAHNQTKFGLATVIKHFKLEVCEKTCKQYKIQPGSFISAPKGGLYLRIKKL